MDAFAATDERGEADGKGVWSWSPDAGIKSVDDFTGDGGNKARFTGESAP